MLHRVLIRALVMCISAIVAVEAAGQGSPQAPPVAPDMTAAPDMTGWNRVGEMRDGQRIIVSVGSGIPMHCVFRGITDHSLFCDSGNLLVGFNKREIARDDVTWLRTDNYPRDRGIVMGVLGGAGVVLGAASPTTPDTGGLRAAQAVLIGGIGAGVGYVAALPIAFFLPGKTIYTQPRPPSAAHSRGPLRKLPAQPVEPAQAQQ